MSIRRRLLSIAFGAVFAPVAAHAQVPDLINAFDAGGRAMGMGGANYATGSETMSGYYNPAGLGYLHRAEVGMALRNLPGASSIVEGDIQGQHSLSTTSQAGPTAITHAGIALPLKGHNGTIGISFTTGGIDRDARFADIGTTSSGTGVPGYQQNLYNRTDFLSFAYGTSNANQNFNWGLAVLYALNHQSNSLQGLPTGNTDFSAAAHGWGGLVGVQFMPMPDLAAGISYRTQINLSGSSLLYSEVPARLSAGLAWRKDMRGDDFLVLGTELSYYFQGSRGQYFDSPAETTAGFGAEYDLSTGNGLVPVRLGYNYVPGAGEDFTSRNTFTFGLGYRPASSDWGVNLDFASPPHGSTDAALDLMYRFGK